MGLLDQSHKQARSFQHTKVVEHSMSIDWFDWKCMRQQTLSGIRLANLGVNLYKSWYQHLEVLVPVLDLGSAPQLAHSENTAACTCITNSRSGCLLELDVVPGGRIIEMGSFVQTITDERFQVWVIPRFAVVGTRVFSEL